MALRVIVARLHMKSINSGSSLIRTNNSFSRMKHFNQDSPLAKHAKKRTSSVRLIANGVAIGVAIGSAYAYFSMPERKLPGSIVDSPTKIPILKTLPPDVKVTRKVRHC